MIKAIIFDCYGVLVLPNMIGVYNKKNKDLIRFIREIVRPHYQTAILSNALSDRLNELIGHDDRSLFDQIVLSFQIGHDKPDTEMYQTVVERLGVKYEECLFTDDSEIFCAAARALGMQAIAFRTTDQFVRDFKKLMAG